jgi:hypothetical protein
MNVRTNLMLPEQLVEEVDRRAGARGRSRYVAEAVEARLRRDRLRDVVEATAGAFKDNPDWKTSEDVVRWVRQLRAEETNPGTPTQP